MTKFGLIQLEQQAAEKNLLLRLQVKRPLNLWALRLVVAQNIDKNKIKILGEMKAWAYSSSNGLQLDTLNILPTSPPGISHLIWSATMLWALEETPCKRARLLAIRDEENQHRRLVRYFQTRGFKISRQLESSAMDLPLRLIWGGVGTLMTADCKNVFEKSYKRWKKLI